MEAAFFDLKISSRLLSGDAKSMKTMASLGDVRRRGKRAWICSPCVTPVAAFARRLLAGVLVCACRSACELTPYIRAVQTRRPSTLRPRSPRRLT